MSIREVIAFREAARLRDLERILPLPRDIIGLILPMLQRARGTPGGCLVASPGGPEFISISCIGATLIRGSSRVDSILCCDLQHLAGGVLAAVDRGIVRRLYWIERGAEETPEVFPRCSALKRGALRRFNLPDYRLIGTSNGYVELRDYSSADPYYVRGHGMQYLKPPAVYLLDTNVSPPTLDRCEI